MPVDFVLTSADAGVGAPRNSGQKLQFGYADLLKSPWGDPD